MPDEIIKKNMVVSLTYTLRDQQGEIFEHTDLPISYIHGGNSPLFAKVEQALEGRRVGDFIEVELAPDEGFGQPDATLTFSDDIANVPSEYRQIGARVEAENARGEALAFIVTKIADGKLTVDANHALAGQTVKFAITVHDVRAASADELRTGTLVHPPTLQ